MERVHIIVTGLVQGVGFRYYAQKEAAGLRLTGFVRNCSDGSVEIEAQGTEEQIVRFIEWAEQGPRNAKVRSIHHEKIHLWENETGFDIR